MQLLCTLCKNRTYIHGDIKGLARVYYQILHNFAENLTRKSRKSMLQLKAIYIKYSVKYTDLYETIFTESEHFFQ